MAALAPPLPPPATTCQNTNWLDSPGVWVWYLSVIGLSWLALTAITSDSGLAWTYVHLVHGVASYWLLHWTKGSFAPEDQGRYGSLTLWEQVDNEMYGTSTRKFLTAVPLGLFVLATHGTDFRKQPLGLNFLVVLVLLIAKLPALHKVRFFGIGA